MIAPTNTCRARRMRVGLLLAALLVSTVGTGCAAVAVGAAAGVAGVFYVTGDVERTYPYPMDIVWEASLSALADLEMDIAKNVKDQLTAEIRAYTATGKRIRLELESDGNVTELELRVNVFGDADLSELILARIESYLPGPPSNEPVLVVPDSQASKAPLELDLPPGDAVSPSDQTE